jgi:hypothetical protein
MTRFLLITTILILGGYFFWRYVWFFRNPPRWPPPGENIVSPADGTVVYVNRLELRQIRSSRSRSSVRYWAY